MVSSESLETLPADFFMGALSGRGEAMTGVPISDESDESDKSISAPVRVPFS